jgi:hypothetical protein
MFTASGIQFGPLVSVAVMTAMFLRIAQRRDPQAA